jgi:hypothetical protein
MDLPNLSWIDLDGKFVFLEKILRTAPYGFLGVIFGVYMAQLGFSLLFCRQSLSQMDVPTRQSCVMAVVDEEDRTPAAGLTNVSRSLSQSVSPSLAGFTMATIWVGLPLFAAGTLKLVYDALIYGSFRKIKPPEEQKHV